MGMEEYKLEAHPVSKKEAIIQGDCYRITMLTSALVRLQYNTVPAVRPESKTPVLSWHSWSLAILPSCGA